MSVTFVSYMGETLMRNLAVFVFIVAAAFGSSLPASAQGRGQAVQLPDGPGKEAVQATCTKCHALNLIASSWGNTKEGWQTLFGSMVELPKDQADSIATYLAMHFPVKPAPEARVIPGPATVSFKEWVAPTLGSRPHDPLAAADGSIWWTGQFASRLGRVDPRTGAIKEFPAQDRRLRAARPGRRQERPTSGSPASTRTTSASSIRRPAKSPSTR